MQWLALLAAAMPWIRFQWAGWTIYPGHWLLSLLLLLLLMRSPARRPGRGELPLKPAMLLGAYICLMAGLRGQWALLAVTGGALLLIYGWGWAAWRMGMATGGTGSFPDGQVLLMAASTAMGLAVWAVMYFWPPAMYLESGWPPICAALACPAPGGGPPSYLGGWSTPGQYLLFLLINLPMVGAFLLMLHRSPGQSGRRTSLAALLVASVMGMMAGARLWMLALALVAVICAAWRLAPLALPGDSRLGKGLALAAVLAALVVYGLNPSYLAVAARGPTGGALLRVDYSQPPPVSLSSEVDTPIRLQLTNTGLLTLAGGSGAPASLGARLLITPEQSRTRAVDVARLPLTQPLAPGRSVMVEVSVRLPHWVREGYLAWFLDSGRGQPAELSADSKIGFRFINRHFRDLNQEQGNFLSALAERARDFRLQTFSPRDSGRSAYTAGNLTGRTLDTLVFSPLWGNGQGGTDRRYPFPEHAPFWLLLFQEYGAIGLGLGLWFAVSLVRRANRIARHGIRVFERVVWRLIPVSIATVIATGIFSADLGSFHGIWGLFLLSGFVEGRHGQLFARRPAPFFPIGRLKWRILPRRPRRYSLPPGRKRRRWRS